MDIVIRSEKQKNRAVAFRLERSKGAAKRNYILQNLNEELNQSTEAKKRIGKIVIDIECDSENNYNFNLEFYRRKQVARKDYSLSIMNLYLGKRNNLQKERMSKLISKCDAKAGQSDPINIPFGKKSVGLRGNGNEEVGDGRAKIKELVGNSKKFQDFSPKPDKLLRSRRRDFAKIGSEGNALRVENARRSAKGRIIIFFRLKWKILKIFKLEQNVLIFKNAENTEGIKQNLLKIYQIETELIMDLTRIQNCQKTKRAFM